ncbi:MAG: nitrogen fixation protein NifQ [Azonexus sp.]|nr:nitrogen fixation protein NifQ [Betaproteobacteria bacterium]MBK8919110.1 nitrogen fixation protein NifQ [Betaproteobacteria bacterium]MBP6036568.1 nitrogen fixation protein NifQ [Azonexus sp.]MBP6907176.1 nitrogen fixation protein NifQ [Azonexus sp.]
MNDPDRTALRALAVAELLAAPCGADVRTDPNRPLLASLLTGQRLGEGCLPADLGLGADRHGRLLAEYFPDCATTAANRPAPPIPEWSDLQKLLLDHRAHERHSELWFADIVATACAGADHLWQDLGLANRDELSRLMWVNFPELARSNTGDMKWKKFVYRQFCAREGIYVCPAPSCGVCKDYAKCFGPES